MLACPHARIDDEFELSVVEFEKGCTIVRKPFISGREEEPTREAMKIDGAEECEEFDSVLRELRKVLVDHLKRAFKDVLHDGRHLVFHEGLETNQYVSFTCKICIAIEKGMHH